MINKFDQNKSPGHDNIGNFIIKKVANEILQPLTAIFNLSLSTGYVPTQLKLVTSFNQMTPLLIPVQTNRGVIWLNDTPIDSCTNQ